MIAVRPYTPDDAECWNELVAQSRNGTFLFDRRYMDYHSDRFADHSLLVFRDDRLYALLPANEKGDTLVSHGGLTYGGLVTDSRCSAQGVLSVFAAINDYLRRHGFRRVVYKAIPWIYHQLPAEEDLYALKAGLRACASTNVDDFWPILNDNLTQKYAVSPVHTADEMRLLQRRFPDNIKLWLVLDGETPVAGTLLFLTPRVLHTQYISATPYGKQHGAIDLLFDHLINNVYADYPYIDFGKSTVSDSADLNAQLIFQKEGFGARAVCYDTYEYAL